MNFLFYKSSKIFTFCIVFIKFALMGLSPWVSDRPPQRTASQAAHRGACLRPLSEVSAWDSSFRAVSLVLLHIDVTSLNRFTPTKKVRVCNVAIPTPIKNGFLFRVVIIKVEDTSSFLP